MAFRSVEAIDSSSSAVGRTFAAVISRDVNGAKDQMLLPSGSPATLILLRDATTGSYELRLASVTLDGDSYLVRNDSEHSDEEGASLGDFLGGVAGPESPSGQIVVTAKTIQVPADSLLTFVLRREIRLIGLH